MDREDVIRQSSTAVELAAERCGSHRALARAADCGARTIGRYIEGEYPPRPDLALKIHEATGIPLAKLRPDIWSDDDDAT